MLTNKKRIYLSSPHMGGAEQKYIKVAFDTNWIAPLGANVDAFEEAIARYCGIKHVVALSSGTAAIHLALILLGVKPGDEVIASSFTFSATINPIVYLGATPVLVDSEPGTWNMDPDLLEEAIKGRRAQGAERRAQGKSHHSPLTAHRLPKAIIVVHLYGMPANMDRIMAIANKYDIPVIEDAAEALGSKYKGKQVGTFGKMGVLSFNGNKIITTSGGGALISDDKEMIDKARFLATQARDKAPHYQHSQIGYNYRMSNVLAGIGCGQMEVIDERVKQRRSNFSFYYENLKKYQGLKFLEEPDKSYFSNHWLTAVIIDAEITGITREDLQKQLEENNIESRPLWKPMHLQPVFSVYPTYLSGVSERLFQNGLCLPSGTGMTDEERQRVLEVLLKCIRKVC
ncbi:MAG: aminotransferase class I/II-fold pyridoxal phosphate-dependent enzyme [Bacteroidales bacterium]|nr:aminotransferase class I/II-fold pyridoxal phosphate-dependent enzyme [Bacteroidales bacterium]